MPSGFQQDINQLKPSYYRVVLANIANYPTVDGNDNGGVTPNSSDSFASLPTTLVLGKARARGNIRFRNIVNRLSNLADCQILDIEITEANANAQATALNFTVKYDRADDILNTVLKLNNSATGYDGITAINSITLAIKDQVARGIGDATTSTIKVAYGTTPNETDTQQLITVAAPDLAANLFADVAVTLIDGTELITA